MTTIYVTQNSREGGGHTAHATQNDARADARAAYEADGEEHHVMKVELNEDLGKRELMCALFNGEKSKYSKAHTVIYTAPARRGRKSTDEPIPEDSAVDYEKVAAHEAANAEDDEIVGDIENSDSENPFGI